MGKLHEVLAVEGGLKKTFDNVINEARTVFSTKQGHFNGFTKTYNKLHEQGLDLLPENKEIVTTVKDKLDYVSEHLVSVLDAIGQKEYTNQKAKADVVVNGKTILKDAPATLLLTLESRLNELRSVYFAIPTLDPAHKWSKDDKKQDVYVSEKSETLKTEKVVEPLVLYPHTDKHVAQVDKITIDKIIGKWTTVNYTGMISPKEKSDLLAKIDLLLREVKQARMRANDIEVEKVSIGKSLVDFINS